MTEPNREDYLNFLLNVLGSRCIRSFFTFMAGPVLLTVRFMKYGTSLSFHLHNKNNF